MDRYSARINLHGNNQRERMANRFIDNINKKAPTSLSYKNVKLNGVPTQLVIDSGTQPYYKEYKSMPRQEINIGDYVEWAKSHWIVFTCDSDDEFYKDGKLYQCNYLLKWQNEFGEIIERWAHIQSASKYNDGTTGNAVVTLGSDQLSVIVPVDEETLRVRKNMGVKFFIDNNKENPTVYELTGTGNVPDTFNGHGVTFWIVKECTYTPTKDDLKFGVCEYRNPHSPIPQKPDDTFPTNVMIDGMSELKVGIPRSFNLVSDQDLDFVWNIVADFPITQKVTKNRIELSVEDESLIDSSFLLQVKMSNSVVAQKTITVIDIV